MDATGVDDKFSCRVGEPSWTAYTNSQFGIVNGTISIAANSMTRFETMIIAMSAMFLALVALAAAFAYMDRRRERRWKMEQDRYDPGGSR